MLTTPKSLRLHIAIFGRTNVGKSTLLNAIAGQDVAITSPVPGTTTDVVEKPMELLPLGPVVFLDTAGLGDESELGAERVKRTRAALNRADVALLVCEAGSFSDHEEEIIAAASERNLPVIVVVNKTDLIAPDVSFLTSLRKKADGVLLCAATDAADRERMLAELKLLLQTVLSDEFRNPPPLVGDLLPPGGLAVLIVPIDLQAPKGRLILPQVQTIRDALDNDAATLVVKEREYAYMLDNLKRPPDLVICDSQVVLKMVADTPDSIPCTTFSILFARLKGDLQALARGAAAIEHLRSGDHILIAESCSHHAMEDDIGRVKIPRWLRQYTGARLEVDSTAGRDFPDDLGKYKLVIQCGGCMNNRAEMLSRLQRCTGENVPVTNYGLCISQTQGVLRRALSPFPAALDAYEREIHSQPENPDASSSS
ncbi:MAG: [FeFe] hydrogenase H-cluster maturation GTPase HydF [Lentisphaeria bacterium]|nr:[FeFe] hydrogenase H-cluster maturation GTPase HydF [Lentisphaeria bacterium]